MCGFYWMCDCAPCMCLLSLGVGYLETVMGGCELLRGHWESHTGPLQGQVLLSAQPSVVLCPWKALFCFAARSLLCSSDWPGTSYGERTGCPLIWGNSIVSVPWVLGLQASVMLPILTMLTWFMGVKQWHFSAGSKGKGKPEVSIAEWKVRLRHNIGDAWERGNPGEPDANPL